MLATEGSSGWLLSTASHLPATKTKNQRGKKIQGSRLERRIFGCYVKKKIGQLSQSHLI
jgi:hypothetical protein